LFFKRESLLEGVSSSITSSSFPSSSPSFILSYSIFLVSFMTWPGANPIVYSCFLLVLIRVERSLTLCLTKS
jgi:hypothetical protein